MSNFSVFPDRWSAMVNEGIRAEQFVYEEPKICVWACRSNLEAWINWIYENDKLELPYDTSLHSLMTQPSFKDLFNPAVQTQMHAIRKLGNKGAHGQTVRLADAMHILKLTYGLNKHFITTYDEYELYPDFDEDKIPPTAKVKENLLKQTIRELQAQLLEEKELHKESLERQEEVQSQRQAAQAKVEVPHDPDEAKTRQIYIDGYLEEAGWNFEDNCTREEPVTGMPSPSGKGQVDYVLWGKDGKPLAVVEAKRSSQKPEAGRHQAQLYAEALEKRYGQKPVIFLTNGYEIQIDDRESPLRPVFGFYSQEELQRLIDRRTTRLPLLEMEINDEITDRYYQKEAIRAVGEHITKANRGALLVMATGTGKTRTAASLIDVFTKANWAKNVLFLADRDALVVQAKNALNTYLPTFPSVDLRVEKENDGSRIIFSTYQTLINLIDNVKTEGERFYTVGHFDLIIFDEIHRSVYNRYKAIFEYFDGYKIGLTATPREDQVHADTYELFGLQKGNPTYSYDLETAIADEHLVPYKSYSVATNFSRNGIKYNELSEKEKRRYEEQFANPVTGEIPDEIEASKLDKWIYNKNTADLILEELMERGIKVENGSRLGKTIIFTRKSDHAHFIQKRFNANYPQYKGDFLRVIDYKTRYSDDLLERFKSPDRMPMIACSVDMLDTGIDVPEVVNLVFLKPVKSPIKFWQMIGRGTRLRPDLFGAGKDKENFLILDFCENFEYFSENPKQEDSYRQESLNERLFKVRLMLSQLLLHQEEEGLQEFGQKILLGLQKQVELLYNEGRDSFVVRRELKALEKFYHPAAWQNLTADDFEELNDKIAPLVYDRDMDSKAKSFDLMMYNLTLSIIQSSDYQATLIHRVMKTAQILRSKVSIPMVKAKIESLQKFGHPDFWQNPTPFLVEKVRSEIRDLIKFLDAQSQEIVIIDFIDEIISVKENPAIYEKYSFDKTAYRRKVEQYIRENKHQLVIDKLRKNIPVTYEELHALEEMLIAQGENANRERLHEIYGEKPLGEFIRSLVGLSKKAAKQAFSELINDANLNPKQINFLNLIIENFVQNGKVTTDQLFNPPYTHIDSGGVIQLFGQDKAGQIRRIIEEINRNGEVG